MKETAPARSRLRSVLLGCTPWAANCQPQHDRGSCDQAAPQHRVERGSPRGDVADTNSAATGAAADGAGAAAAAAAAIAGELPQISDDLRVMAEEQLPASGASSAAAGSAAATRDVSTARAKRYARLAACAAAALIKIRAGEAIRGSSHPARFLTRAPSTGPPAVQSQNGLSRACSSPTAGASPARHSRMECDLSLAAVTQGNLYLGEGGDSGGQARTPRRTHILSAMHSRCAESADVVYGLSDTLPRIRAFAVQEFCDRAIRRDRAPPAGRAASSASQLPPPIELRFGNAATATAALRQRGGGSFSVSGTASSPNATYSDYNCPLRRMQAALSWLPPNCEFAQARMLPREQLLAEQRRSHDLEMIRRTRLAAATDVDVDGSGPLLKSRWSAGPTAQ
mmetsp:Transcript_26180/g.77682  ORF Transcript_26180/g.77682 Transcript_26180/m.77682 type:complete len:397 (-) Transcript_26180:521-1711(-)